MKSILNVALISVSLLLVAPNSVAGTATAQTTSQDSPQNQSPSQPPSPDAAVPPAQPAPDASLPQTQTSTPPTPAPEKTKPAYKSSPKKPRAKTKTSGGTPSGKVVVKNGGARDTSGQISPGISAEQELHQRETTSQLLATTDANLKKIEGRPLTSTQQNMLEQIHSYLSQAKTAANAQDLTRAHTLAFKAHLLSDELARK
jgi:hypothetical protein